jgi:hypothetical protein
MEEDECRKGRMHDKIEERRGSVTMMSPVAVYGNE